MRRWLWERLYPYVLALAAAAAARTAGFNLIGDANMGSALESVITLTAIIIGFLGAILPVVLSMKGASKAVDGVFRADTDRLFPAYVREALAHGLMLILMCVLLFFRDSYQGTVLHAWAFYGWIFLLVQFVLSTYRSVGSILKLMFLPEQDGAAAEQAPVADADKLEAWKKKLNKTK